MRFVKEKIEIHAGDTVEWGNFDPEEPWIGTLVQWERIALRIGFECYGSLVWPSERVFPEAVLVSSGNGMPQRYRVKTAKRCSPTKSQYPHNEDFGTYETVREHACWSRSQRAAQKPGTVACHSCKRSGVAYPLGFAKARGPSPSTPGSGLSFLPLFGSKFYTQQQKTQGRVIPRLLREKYQKLVAKGFYKLSPRPQ